MKCSSCGAEINDKAKFCEFCGSQISLEMKREQEQLNKVGCPKCGSTNTSFSRESQGVIKNHNSTEVVMATVGLCKDCGYTWKTDETEKPKSAGTMALWVCGWVFFFPAPLMVLIWRKKCTWDVKVKILVTVLFWVALAVIGEMS